MRKKIILAIMILTASLFMGACSGKYMLSGTWYSDERTMRTFVFYDNGDMKIDDKDTRYEMDGQDTIIIHNGDHIISAVIDRDTETIQCPQESGLSVCLYKDATMAGTAAAEKEQTLNSEMEEKLEGRWVLISGNDKTVAEFKGDRLIMTTIHDGKSQSSEYKIEFVSKEKVRFISGREVVAEFELETDDTSLTFHDGEKTTIYKKENVQ